ncbi:MAG: type II toxin-antitoxin system VapC family toxin [Treponema sp.]|jgi:predicted nucleic acid-binding protein|nr:type II toxin-antitoxin system VapC family toxin [Treponema sp.]
MNVIDSSFWIEFFKGNLKGTPLSELIKHNELLYVPTIVIYEVFKKLMVDTTEEIASAAIVQMRKGIVVDLDSDLALNAAYISREQKLPMADSIIYATTLRYNATLWTQDKHFEGLSQVRYSPKSV